VSERVCVNERVRIIPFQFFNQFADFRETCYECYVIRTHSTLRSDCMQSVITEG